MATGGNTVILRNLDISHDKRPGSMEQGEDWSKPGSSRDDASHSPDKCMVCGKMLVPPVTRCSSGHGVCYVCWHRTGRNCLCGSPFDNESALKDLPPDTKFSCMNRPKGCTQKLTLDVLEEHESTCPYNPNSPVMYCLIL
ncbi:hypothetical protein C0J52_22801 [Blattella germanica]|nr:hypothetical protein C0J52_22801 [Blattella germanica]